MFTRNLKTLFKRNYKSTKSNDEILNDPKTYQKNLVSKAGPLRLKKFNL
jgi:hypothetical protein